MTKRILRSLGMAALLSGMAGATALGAATPAQRAPLHKPLGPSASSTSKTAHAWNGQVAVNADGTHTLGNPEAPLKLVEYVSYTCPHCAHFTKDSEVPLRLTVVPRGQVSVTVSNVLRNAIDVAAALIVNCGDDKRFFVRHTAMLASQDKWIGAAQNLNDAQKARWSTGTLPERLRAIASDMGFYDMAEGWGMNRPQVDQCLGNSAMLDKLRAQQDAAGTMNVKGTPSFAINGSLVEDAYSWDALQPVLVARIAALRNKSS